MNKSTVISIFFLILLASCNGQSTKNKNIAILNTVWETMNTQYFDSTFGGLDWQKEYEFYKPIIEKCKSNDCLYYHLNKMLFKLGVSHLGVVPPDEVNTVGDPQLFLDGTVGLDVRYINNKAIVVSVQKKSSAQSAGIKKGFEITEINNRKISKIVSKRTKEPTPPFNKRNLNSMISQDIIRELYGNPNEIVSLTYLDKSGNKHNAKLVLKQRDVRKTSITPDLPEIYARVNSKIIQKNIAYIRFDVFHPVILDKIIQLIAKYHEVPNLIIDIRGNPGGDFNTRKTIAEKFVSERTLFWVYHHRNETREVFLEPAENPYTGKVVILIDELCGSSSEEFAGGMQGIGCATIIGQQTAGKVLTMEVITLPEGALFVYPNSQTRTAKNKILEGVGVIPDIKVVLTQKSLLEGRDIQLETAIKYLNDNQ
jgi:carboxyl-terminal processing protease